MYSLYSILLLLALVVSAPWWLLEMLRHGKYRAGLGERLGKVPGRLRHPAAANTIWIHAVSVGEVLAISRVIDELKSQLQGWRVVVSTTTDTGQKLARERGSVKDVPGHFVKDVMRLNTSFAWVGVLSLDHSARSPGVGIWVLLQSSAGVTSDATEFFCNLTFRVCLPKRCACSRARTRGPGDPSRSDADAQSSAPYR